MKKHIYGLLFGLSLLIQGGSLWALSRLGLSRYEWEKMSPVQRVERISAEWGIADADKELLRQAIEENSAFIPLFERDPRGWSERYNSNALRAARDLARITQGDHSRMYIILDRMLSFK